MIYPVCDGQISVNRAHIGWYAHPSAILPWGIGIGCDSWFEPRWADQIKAEVGVDKYKKTTECNSFQKNEAEEKKSLCSWADEEKSEGFKPARTEEANLSSASQCSFQPTSVRSKASRGLYTVSLASYLRKTRFSAPVKLIRASDMFYRVCSSDTKHYSSLSLLVNSRSLYPPSCCVLVQTETRCLTSPPVHAGKQPVRPRDTQTHGPEHTQQEAHMLQHFHGNTDHPHTQSVCMLITSSFSLMGGEGGFIYNSCCWGEREREL